MGKLDEFQEQEKYILGEMLCSFQRSGLEQ